MFEVRILVQNFYTRRILRYLVGNRSIIERSFDISIIAVATYTPIDQIRLQYIFLRNSKNTLFTLKIQHVETCVELVDDCFI